MSTVLITGGSGGIGAACCELFAVRGWNVVIGYYRNEYAACALEKRLNAIRPSCAYAVYGDVSDGASVNEMFERAYAYFPELHALVNCAGIALQKTVTNTTEQDWEKVFDVNAKGVFLCCKKAADIMLKRQTGAIVNMSSVWGMAGASCEGAYSASKGAVIAFTKALAKELAPCGIRVNCVAPGAIDTPMLNVYSKADLTALADQTPLGFIGVPADAAACAYFLCSKEAGFITGQVLSPNGGILI